MAAVPLSNDTALCLAASALQGDLTLSRSQRELVKAVAQTERVEDIVRHSRLPERLAKRELQVLLERGLLALKEPDSVRYRERQSSGIERDGAEDRHSVTRLTDEGEGLVPELAEPAIESPRRAAAAVARWVQVPPRVIGRPRPDPTEAHEEALDSEMEAAFERLRSSPSNSLGDDGGRPPRHTRVPSTLPSGTPGSVDLPGEFRLPSLPPGFKAPRPDASAETVAAGPGQPRSTLRSPDTSGTNPATSGDDLDPALPSRPPPRFSGIEALKPGDSAQAQSLGLAAGAEPLGGPVIPRFSAAGPDAEDRLGTEPIPLVTVVRSPMITVGQTRPNDAMATHPATPNLNPLQILNASHNPRPGVGSNTRPGMGNVPHPGGASAPGPQPTGGSSQVPGRRVSPGLGATVTLPPSSEPRSGSTIEGMPAQSSAPPGQLQPTPLGNDNPLGRTAIGGISAPPDPNRRPSVVVRPAGRDSIPDGTSSGFDASPTGKTLLGVIAPTAEQLRQAPANDSLHSSMDAKASATSTTMPSLRAGEIHLHLGASTASQGDQHLDHYEIIECLARGGAGVVYKVRDPHAEDGHFLALKVLRQGTHRVAENVESFVHEARLMGALAHPNLVELRYFGHENDEPFLLMEFVEGLSMSDLLHHPVPLPLDVGLIIIQDALQALDYVHNAQLPELAPHGLVHCDVSPQNLLVGADGYTRLIDFGTSRSPGLIVGDAAVRCKPRYSSPELIAGEAVSAESDIFSMGAVLFQLLSKQPAFSADPTRRKRESLVPNPSMLNRRAPTPFDPICQRALDPDPGSRFASAREMLETLDSAVEVSGIELRRQRINFWVKRVLQSRHGDVEFDMAELEDLLDNKRSFSSRPPAVAPSNKPPSSNPEHTKNVEPRKGRSVPPPAVSRTPTREFVAPQEEQYVDSSPPSSDGSIGAASRFETFEKDSPLRLKTRLWVTGAAIGAFIAISTYALLGPPSRTAFLTPESSSELPTGPDAPEAPSREDVLPRSVNSLPPSDGLPPASVSPEPTELEAPVPTLEIEPVRPIVAPVNDPEPSMDAQEAPPRQDTPRAVAPRPAPRSAPPRVAPHRPAPPSADPEPAPEPAAPPTKKTLDSDTLEAIESPEVTRPNTPEVSESPEPAPSQPPPRAAPPPSASPPPSAAPAPRISPVAPRTPRTEALPDRSRPTAPIRP